MPLLVLLLVILSALAAAAGSLVLGHPVWMAFAIYAGVVQLAALGALAAPPLARALASGMARLSKPPEPASLRPALASPASG